MFTVSFANNFLQYDSHRDKFNTRNKAFLAIMAEYIFNTFGNWMILNRLTFEKLKTNQNQIGLHSVYDLS